jgi:ATP synthase protein I
MARLTDRPETTMVKRALVPALVAFAAAASIAWLAGGRDAGVSAGIGVAIVFFNFAAHGLSLAWASTLSVGVVMAVALGGFVVRLGVVVAAMFALSSLSWFSPVAFGLTVVPATMLLLGYEAWLAMNGLGGTLQIPADPAATRRGVASTVGEAR